MFSKFPKFTNNLKFFNKIAKKGFKERLGFKEQGSSSNLGYIFTGAAVAGFSYLMWDNHRRNAQLTKSMIASGQTVGTDISLKRTRDTLLYFAGGLTMTSGMVAGMLRSQNVLRWSSSMVPLLMTIPVSMFCIYKMHTLPPSPQNNLNKHLYWMGFNASIAFSLVPLIAMSELLVVRDAFLLTAGTFGGLGLVAYNARDDAFLGMSGYLGAGLGAIAVIGIANIFLQSNALFNVWLYGGLALFLGLTMYDMKEIQNKAKRSVYFDPMAKSIGVYLDFINIFTRLLFILQSRKNRK